MIVTRFSQLLLCTAVWVSASQPDPSQLAFQFPEFPPEKPIMKAWFCDGKTQRNLVEHLRQAQIIKSPAVQAAMSSVDRMYYMVDDYANNPYADAPQSILKGQTISAPHMHAYSLEEIVPSLLKRQKEILESGDPSQQSIKILDVGCGSGYLTACFGRLFKPRETGQQILTVPGSVFGMDIHRELVDMTEKNIRKADADLLDQGVIRLRAGNGWEGWEEEAPFDAIHVGAAAASIPTDLVKQLLAPHGVLIVPVGAQNGVQKLLKIQRLTESYNVSSDDLRVTELLQVRYVPLVEKPENLRP